MIEKSTFIQLKKRTVMMTALFVIHKCRREVKHVHVSLILEKYLLIRYGGSRTRTYEPYGVDLQSTAIATMRFPPCDGVYYIIINNTSQHQFNRYCETIFYKIH